MSFVTSTGREFARSTATRYDSSEEARAARLEAKRRYQKARHRRYGQLCKQLGVPQKSRNWERHFQQLRLAGGCQYRLYWLHRFPLAELAAMGAALDFLERAA